MFCLSPALFLRFFLFIVNLRFRFGALITLHNALTDAAPGDDSPEDPSIENPVPRERLCRYSKNGRCYSKKGGNDPWIIAFGVLQHFGLFSVGRLKSIAMKKHSKGDGFYPFSNFENRPGHLAEGAGANVRWRFGEWVRRVG